MNEDLDQLIRILGHISSGLTKITSQLRHAYKQLNDETVIKQKEFGDGLIAPQIQRLEDLEVILQKGMAAYEAVRDRATGDTRH